MEDDSTSPSQAALDEQLEANEKNGPIPFLSGALEGKLYLTECVPVRKSLKCILYNRTVAVTNFYDI